MNGRRDLIGPEESRRLGTEVKMTHIDPELNVWVYVSRNQRFDSIDDTGFSITYPLTKITLLPIIAEV